MYEKVKQFVQKSFNQGINEKSMEHFDKTVDWLMKIYPSADEAMKIAAYSHDIARAFRIGGTADTFKGKEFNDPEILREHQDSGAKIIKKFLLNQGYKLDLSERVANMIAHHEEGGDNESDIIKDADSLSYLEVNAKKHIGMVKDLGKEKIENKIDWMYNRISSPEAKKLATPYYEEVKSLIKS